MKQLFPPEIIEFTSENYFYKFSKTSQVIYISVLVALLAAVVALPFIKVEVTTQSRGVIKSETENNQLMAMVYGEVERISISENKNVAKGDTLVIINARKLQEQVAAYERNRNENLAFKEDIQTILNDSPENIKTPKYISQYNEYATQLKEQQLQTELLKHEKEISDKLYIQIEELRSIDVDIQYDRKQCTFCYAGNKKVMVREPIVVISNEELVVTNGGFFAKKSFRSFFWTEQRYLSRVKAFI